MNIQDWTEAWDTEEFRRYAETTNALLQSPGGQRWLTEGGEANISREVRGVQDEYGAVSIKGFAE